MLRPSHMEERLPLRGTHDELDELSRTINRFLDKIADFVARNREFVAHAAHELRSPLAAIQSSVEVALNSDRTTEQYKDLLCEIVAECGSLGALVNQLLLLAENDAGNQQTEQRPVPLTRMVNQAIEMFRPAAEERGILLEPQAFDDVTVAGDAARLRQVVNNLIDNSLKFTNSGGRVIVRVARDVDRSQALLRVSDTGLGIAPDDLPHIFERFYRGDKSRHRETPTSGTGLGLSICQAIVEAHGGEISVQSALGKGTQFTVRLPLAAEMPLSEHQAAEQAAAS